MVNASFVFGMDGDRPDVFDRTVAWAVQQGIETATFQIMTPYPGTGLYARMAAAGRKLHSDWDRPIGLTPGQLEEGYRRAYRDFYRWSAIWRGARTTDLARDRLRHLAYAGGWKKFEPLWDVLIRTGQVLHALPLLESVLGSFGGRAPRTQSFAASPPAPSRPASSRPASLPATSRSAAALSERARAMNGSASAATIPEATNVGG